jgi:hypothetical protein
MEVTLLDAQNLPASPVMTINAGSVRRQVKLELNKPFMVPASASESKSLQVSLFQQVASQVLPNDNRAHSFCRFNADNPLSGTSSSEVHLRIHRGKAALANAEVPKASFEKMLSNADLTKDYVEKHRLKQCIQSLIQDVLRTQPDNPYGFMIKQLRAAKGTAKYGKTESRETSRPASREAHPIVPRLPETAKPERMVARHVPGVRRGQPKDTEANSQEAFERVTELEARLEVLDATLAAKDTDAQQSSSEVPGGQSSPSTKPKEPKESAASGQASTNPDSVEAVLKYYPKAFQYRWTQKGVEFLRSKGDTNMEAHGNPAAGDPFTAESKRIVEGKGKSPHQLKCIGFLEEVKTCPAGHLLQEETPIYEGAMCGESGKVIHAGEKRFRCRICNYNQSSMCHKAAPPADLPVQTPEASPLSVEASTQQIASENPGAAMPQSDFDEARHGVRREIAASMSSLVMNSVREKIIAMASADTSRGKRGSIVTAPNPVYYTSGDYDRALAKWGAHLAFRGACKILGYGRKTPVIESYNGGSAEPPVRRNSVPTPVVHLDSVGDAWGGSISNVHRRHSSK